MNLAASDLTLRKLDDADVVLRKASDRKLEALNFAFDRYMLAFQRADEAGMESAATAVQGMQGAAPWMIDMQASALAYSRQLCMAREQLQRTDTFSRQLPTGEFAAYHEAASAMLEAYLGDNESAKRHAVTALKLSRGKDIDYLGG
jgi:hypothetical protein